MKIAYLISAYKDPKQLGRMLKALYEDETYFYIHVDAKVNQQEFENAVPEFARSHTTFTTKRYWIHWGGFNQVKYQKELLSVSLGSNIDFDRVFLLTAQDYPLWSNKQIADELSFNPNKQYIIGLNISELAKQGGVN